jgi:hypothetical protein
MIALLLALAATSPCIPIATDQLRPAQSALEQHRVLRRELREPLPVASNMVMLFGSGGHLETLEYSIILAKAKKGDWHGTAVGRRKIWIEGAPWTTMPRKEWTLDRETGRRLSKAISRRCPFDRSKVVDASPPPLGYIGETIDLFERGHAVTFSEEAGGQLIGEMVRPPK